MGFVPSSQFKVFMRLSRFCAGFCKHSNHVFCSLKLLPCWTLNEIQWSGCWCRGVSFTLACYPLWTHSFQKMYSSKIVGAVNYKSETTDHWSVFSAAGLCLWMSTSEKQTNCSDTPLPLEKNLTDLWNGANASALQLNANQRARVALCGLGWREVEALVGAMLTDVKDTPVVLFVLLTCLVNTSFLI